MLIVMGLPGVGKSSVLKSIQAKRPKVKIVNYGDLLFFAAKKRFNLSDRDKIVGLSMKDHMVIQNEAIKEIDSGPMAILDTHAVLKKPSGFLPGLSPELLERPGIEGFIFIDAPTRDIIERRTADPARTRPAMTAEELNGIRSASFSNIAVYSAATAKPVFILINRKGKMGDTVEEFDHILRALGWE